jgi:DNA-binding CsgD family transcriptional regulator
MTEDILHESYSGNPWGVISFFSNHLVHHFTIEDFYGVMRMLKLIPSFEAMSIYIANDSFSTVMELKLTAGNLETFRYPILDLSHKVIESIACGEILLDNSIPKSSEISKRSIVIPVPIKFTCLEFVGVGPLEMTDDFRLAIKSIASIFAVWFRPLVGSYIGRDSIAIEEQLAKLSKRQLEIFTHMTIGLTNVEIAALIGYSESLVKSESVKIFQKLGISGRRDPKLQAYLAKSK